ncbi:Uncharacterized protein Rs2_28878 [Raphanus sativus]|nr:Uncharacterized protein Rs2_28878 [Raphanus sativus]
MGTRVTRSSSTAEPRRCLSTPETTTETHSSSRILGSDTNLRPPENFTGLNPRSPPKSTPLASTSSPHQNAGKPISTTRELHQIRRRNPQIRNQTKRNRSIKSLSLNTQTEAACSPLTERSNIGAPKPTVHREDGATTGARYLTEEIEKDGTLKAGNENKQKISLKTIQLFSFYKK